MKSIRFPKLDRLLILLFWVALLSSPLEARAQQSTAPKRVLVLYWYDKGFPGHIVWDQSFQATLKSAPDAVDYYPEYLEANRFPGENQSQALHDYLLKKYADRGIDVVVAQSDASLNFLLKYRDDLFPRAPIVYYAGSQPVGVPETRTDLTGVIVISSYRRTLELALSLNLGVNQVFVISGTLEHDKRFEILARKELQGLVGRVQINYLTDLSPEELIGKTATLPERSMILYAWQQARDNQGNLLESVDILHLLTRTASAPIFGMSGPLVGHGIIGGYVYTPEAGASKVAEIVRRIAGGVRAQDIPVESVPTVPMFDWRELKRWGINEQSLPPGSDVRFREFTFWQQYRWHIIGLLAFCAIEALLIAILLVERRRRLRVNAELDERVRFETLLSKLSAEFVDLPERNVAAVVRLWIERLKDFLGDTEISFFEVPRSGQDHLPGNSHDTALLPKALAVGDVQKDEWSLAQLRRGTTINFAHVPTRFSAEQDDEKTPGQLKSLLAIPVAVSGSTFALTFENTKSFRTWPDDHVSQLRLVCEVFASAVERRRAGEELAKTRNDLAHVARLTAMGEMAASIAHEVNQPLAAIAAYGDACVRLLAGDSPNVTKSLEAINHIISDSMRASEVIKRIRGLVKKTDHESTPQDLNQIILEMAALTDADVLSRSVKLELYLDDELPLVMGDRVELQQVMLNLILNGVEAMGTVKNRARKLTITSSKNGNGTILVAVKDSGVGLTLEQSPLIFDPFVTTKPNGLGMGLSISRTILQTHGGKLWAEQNEGHGATFQFTLPKAATEP